MSTSRRPTERNAVRAGNSHAAADNLWAAASFQRTLQVNPVYAEEHNNLALALVQLGRLEDAIRSYRRALEINPDFLDAHYSLGSVLMAQGNTKEAIAAFQQALGIEPDFTKEHNNLGSAFR